MWLASEHIKHPVSTPDYSLSSSLFIVLSFTGTWIILTHLHPTKVTGK